MKLVKAAVAAVVKYALSKEASKLERALLAGIGVAVLGAIKAGLGVH